MEFQEREFVPMLLGGDINTYSVARAFYEEYQVKTYIFGKFPSGPSFNSRIIEYTANELIDTDDVFLATVNKMAARFSDKKVLLIGCGDSYVALCSRFKDQLPDNVIAPYIDYTLMDELIKKERFYQLCDKHGVDYPDTFVYKQDMNHEFTLEFPFPVILKPSNGIDYWAHPYPTQKKVYKIDTREELDKVIDQVYDAGYSDSLIIQDVIPGNDEYMRVLTSYSGKDKKVKMMCLGHVLLEEHTPHGLGNHACIITEPNENIMSGVKALLEDLGYTGYSNFDIKYDERDGKFKFFEINTRQGRSNFYVTGSGFNVAKYFVEDYIYNKDIPFEIAKEERLWLVVPKRVVYKYVKDDELKAKVRSLISQGKYVNPIFLKGDLQPKRFYAMFKNYMSHYVKFKKYYK